MRRHAHVIVNPVAGTAHREPATDRARRAMSRLAAAGFTAEATVTTHPLHALEVARGAADTGASLVVVWGGDGTVNEAARGLLHRDTALAIVPRGSGNGFARDLRIPLQPGDALDVAASAAARPVDAGTLGGLPFVNLAGIGLMIGSALMVVLANMINLVHPQYQNVEFAIIGGVILAGVIVDELVRRISRGTARSAQ